MQKLLETQYQDECAEDRKVAHSPLFDFAASMTRTHWEMVRELNK